LDGQPIAGVLECANVTYDPVVNVPEVMLDLYVPPTYVAGTRAPAIIYMHGGGWFSGSKAEVGAQQFEYLKSGYFVISISYRLSGLRPTPNPVNMTSGAPPVNATDIQDVKTAIQFVRKNYAGFIDMDKLIAWGFSAGGHLAVLAGVSSNDELLHPEVKGRSPGGESSAVAAVVAQSPTVDLGIFIADPMPVCGSLALDPDLCGTVANPIPGKCVTDPQCSGASCVFGDQYTTLGRPALTQMLGAPITDPAVGVTASVTPITYVDADDPPMYLLAGKCDCTNPPIQVQDFGPAATAKGGRVTIKMVETAGHGETLGDSTNPGGSDAVKAWLVSQGFPESVP
jgi:acetyl esterase/lipase